MKGAARDLQVARTVVMMLKSTVAGWSKWGKLHLPSKEFRCVPSSPTISIHYSDNFSFPHNHHVNVVRANLM